jgi:membrane protease YdiL (CAAX protease family)
MKASPGLRAGILAAALWLGYIVAWHPWPSASRNPRLEALPGANVAYFIWLVAVRSDPFKNVWWDLTVGVIEIGLITAGVAWILAALPMLKYPTDPQDRPRARNRLFQISVIVVLFALGAIFHDFSDWSKATLRQMENNTSEINGQLAEAGETLSRMEGTLADIEDNTRGR